MTLHFDHFKSICLKLACQSNISDRHSTPSPWLFAIATLSFTSLFLPAPATQAQISRISPQDLGIPTESQRFFSQGRQQFQREVDRLQDRSQRTSEPLQIDETINPQNTLQPLEDPRIQLRTERDRPKQFPNSSLPHL